MKTLALTTILLTLLACEKVETVETQVDGSAVETTGLANIDCDLNKLNLSAELGAPQTIEQAIDLINALPKPVTIACFVQTLQRPLRVNATSSILSAQPAMGEDNPRIFLFSGDDLIISIVPDGNGKDLMEFSQLVNGTSRSIKGEIKFPVFESIPYSAPYNRILTGAQTVCSACHVGEALDDTHQEENVYISAALKPKANKLVFLSDFWQEYYNCSLKIDTSDSRCMMIRAIFDYGKVEHQDFPASMPTYFESLGF